MKIVCVGMNLRDAIRLAQRVGIEIRPRPGTGESWAILPNGQRLAFNARRKDAPRELTSSIRRVMRGAGNRPAMVVKVGDGTHREPSHPAPLRRVI